MLASALCAPTAWSADRVAKGHRTPASYPGPRCDDPAVVDQIVAEYRGRHWASGFDVLRVREANWESWPQHLIPRRFCEGQIKARLGPKRLIYPIYYAIIADGPKYQVASCVVGPDHGWPYDQRCRLARP